MTLAIIHFTGRQRPDETNPKEEWSEIRLAFIENAASVVGWLKHSKGQNLRTPYEGTLVTLYEETPEKPAHFIYEICDESGSAPLKLEIPTSGPQKSAPQKTAKQFTHLRFHADGPVL